MLNRLDADVSDTLETLERRLMAVKDNPEVLEGSGLADPEKRRPRDILHLTSPLGFSRLQYSKVMNSPSFPFYFS